MTVHELKTHPEPFEATRRGVKPFEVRKITDRRFEEGDLLLLREWDPLEQRYTGRHHVRQVTYVCQGKWGLPDDVAVLGLQAVCVV